MLKLAHGIDGIPDSLYKVFMLTVNVGMMYEVELKCFNESIKLRIRTHILLQFLSSKRVDNFAEGIFLLKSRSQAIM